MISKNYILFINCTKIINAIKLFISYGISVALKRVFVWGYPAAISIEPSSICNLNCTECLAGNKTLNRESGLLDYELFETIIDQVKNYTLYLNLYLQGEPFINPLLFKMINYAHANNIYSCTSTNGHFIDSETSKKIVESGLKKIIISVDGTTQETYERYRQGGNLNKVFSGIEILSKIKKEYKSKTPVIEIQFIVFKHNQHEIKEIQRIGKEIGANNVVLKSAQIQNPNSNFELIPTIEEFARYKKNKYEYKIKSRMNNRCFNLWKTIVITQEGEVVPCCFDKNAEHKIGNVKNLTILVAWKSALLNNFRKKILSSRKKVSICCNCSNGLRIKY